MPRTTHPPEMDLLSRLNQLSATGEGAPDLPAKLALLTAVRAQSPEAFKWADRFLVEEVDRLAYQLREAQAAQAKLRALHETLTAPPWHPAVYLGSGVTVQGLRAMVLCNGGRRVVGLGEGVDPAGLEDRPLDPDLCRRLRASILLAGPLLARFGSATMPPPA